MNIQISEERPPYVVFETRPVEDRQASLDEGHTCWRNEDFAIITPAGSKDRIERLAIDWLAHIRREANQQRFREDWCQYYHSQFKAWKEGQELPPNGLPLQEWPGMTPALLKTLQAMGIRSVEDLANCNEEAVHRLGMGGRAIKDRARNFLAASADVGKVSEKLSALEVENEGLRTRNTDLEHRLSALEKTLEALQPKSEPATEAKTKGGGKDVEFS